jgi:hypothetical protein
MSVPGFSAFPPPWRESSHTQIWDVTERARKFGTECPQDDASIAVWFVHAPWMAPLCAWHWHYVGLIHLRDLPGQSKPAVHTLAGSTHELIVLALDPQFKPDLNAAEWEQPKFLSPVSIVQQFIAANDAEALKRIEEGLALCVEGRLSLESDGRLPWRNLLLSKDAA